MIVNCPHCAKQLKLSDKVSESLQQLEPGRRIKIKCINCGTPFGLDKSMQPVGPGQAPVQKPAAAAAPKTKSAGLKPPAPRNLDWLRDGTFQDKEVVEDIPSALILMREGSEREQVIRAVESVGYRVELADDVQDAMDRMRFVTYSAVLLHTGFEPGDFAKGLFHTFMKDMNMSRRRYIFYVLIGPQFTTLYDLEAMTYSANVVVNDAEIQYMSLVLKKAIPEYEELFGPILEELRLAGKV